MGETSRTNGRNGHMIWEDMRKSALKRIVNWQTKNIAVIQSLNLTPCLDDHHFKEEELESFGERSKVFSQIVLKGIVNWHELVDLTFFGQWTNLLDQSPSGQELVTDVQLV